MKRLLLIAICGISGAAAICCVIQPINSTILRVFTIASIFAFFVSSLLLAWQHKAVRLSLLAIPILFIVIVSLPGRSFDIDRLRQRYADSLHHYSNVPYVWGGEGKMGIDCSGLPRRALRDALIAEGLTTMNGRLIREAIRQWWFDASARALSEGYKGYMSPLFATKALRNTDLSSLKPGDVAITNSGIHCLVYFKGNTWIQADPNVGKVEDFDARNTESSWFDDPVHLYRWTWLQN